MQKNNEFMQKDNLIMLNSAIDIFDECGKAQGKAAAAKEAPARAPETTTAGGLVPLYLPLAITAAAAALVVAWVVVRARAR